MGINSQVLKANWLSPLEDSPFSQESPIRIKDLYPLVNWIGDINLLASWINRDRSRVPELSIATSVSTPNRQHFAIRIELNDASATLIDYINRVVRTDGNPSRPIEAGVGAFPRSDERPIGRQLSYTMIGGDFCYVNIASPINRDSIRLSQLPVAASFASYGAKKGASRREFLDTAVIRVGDQNISVGISSNSCRGIKLSVVGSLAAFEHGSRTFRQRAGLKRRRPGRSRQRSHALLKLANILVRDIQHVKRP